MSQSSILQMGNFKIVISDVLTSKELILISGEGIPILDQISKDKQISISECMRLVVAGKITAKDVEYSVRGMIEKGLKVKFLKG